MAYLTRQNMLMVIGALVLMAVVFNFNQIIQSNSTITLEKQLTLQERGNSALMNKIESLENKLTYLSNHLKDSHKELKKELRKKLILPMERNLTGDSKAHNIEDIIRANIHDKSTLSAEEVHTEQIILEKMQYWEYPDRHTHHAPKRSIPDRYMTFVPWRAGHNNKRMSLEIAYVMAMLTNRTLVLPEPSVTYPYKEIFRTSDSYNLYDMKSGHPTIQYYEFINHPDYKEIIKSKATCIWKDFSSGSSTFVYPELPKEGTPEMEKLQAWRHNRKYADPPNWGVTLRDSNSEPNFKTAKLLEFGEQTFFNHFYLHFYFRESHKHMFKETRRMVRDHVHFMDEMWEAAARIIVKLPKSYSAFHYRRGDLQFKENRNIKPETIYENTLGLLQEGEDIYVATDEDPQVFKDEFESVMGKRYNIHTFSDYASLVTDLPNWWVPLVEMIVCTQGRVFVGTLQSTMSGYIQRMRGYMRHLENKELYFTIKKFPQDYPLASTNAWTWNREYELAWRGIDDDDTFVI